ncbi:MAG: hypothetical protein IJ785_05230 [Bacteroidales bacterium]|nr:hypothetical protein [Bacteroidales bacterium]
MKYAWTILIALTVLVSCNHMEHQNEVSYSQDSLVEWYNSVFTTSETDTTFSIPDYVLKSDWMQRYSLYIDRHFTRNGDIWIENKADNPFDCRYWTLAYVDNDTIPEMLLYGGCNASASVILTQHNGEVYVSPRGLFSYIKGSGLLHSQFRFDDETWGEVYEMTDGRFVERCSYNCSTVLIDTSDIDKFSLSKEDLTCYQIGDSTVWVNEIKLNDKRIGTCYGHNQWNGSSAFFKVKQTLDSLYYSKGISNYFPLTSRRITIDTITINNPLFHRTK